MGSMCANEALAVKDGPVVVPRAASQPPPRPPPPARLRAQRNATPQHPSIARPIARARRCGKATTARARRRGRSNQNPTPNPTTQGDTIIEATSGNTGIALAMAAAIKGAPRRALHREEGWRPAARAAFRRGCLGDRCSVLAAPPPRQSPPVCDQPSTGIDRLSAATQPPNQYVTRHTPSTHRPITNPTDQKPNQATS
jgi:hypothetical protein